MHIDRTPRLGVALPMFLAYALTLGSHRDISRTYLLLVHRD